MQYLLDTGILLRVVNRDDPLHADVRRAVRRLKDGGHVLVTTPQNMSAFWNVSTRPASARGGLGLSVDECHRRLRLVERVAAVLPEVQGVYEQWKRLVVAHAVLGVQVHDARMVATMAVHGLSNLLTLNKSDFARYTGVTAVTPVDVLSATPLPP